MYKNANGLDVVEWEEEIELRNIRRCHEINFTRESLQSRKRNDFANYVSNDIIFFTNRLTETWNILPSELVNSQI